MDLMDVDNNYKETVIKLHQKVHFIATDFQTSFDITSTFTDRRQKLKAEAEKKILQLKYREKVILHFRN